MFVLANPIGYNPRQGFTSLLTATGPDRQPVFWFYPARFQWGGSRGNIQYPGPSQCGVNSHPALHGHLSQTLRLL